MSAKRPPKSRNRRSPRRLLLEDTRSFDEPITIPTRWLNFVIALFLLPVGWILTQALFATFAHAATENSFWATEEFWFFALGTVLWLLMFAGSIWVFGEPRFLRLYVLGHEFTHALWARAMGGKVYQFKVSREGGFIVTDRHNFWIALAPYFYPLYSIVVIGIYGAVSLFYDVSGQTRWLFGALGLTWAFHFSFTLWMIPKGQSDLSTNGTFFSLVVIYLMNLLILSALLIFAAPEVNFQTFWRSIEHNGIVLSDWVIQGINATVRALNGAG
ncbi:MAG: hypothetical protein ABI680_15000 [Chthoniobacteraceae bacterium]